MIVSIRSNMNNLKTSKDNVALLAVRLVTLTILVALMTMHLRSLRVFRWEQSVSGGLLVTYCVASLGLALCAGIENCGAKAMQVYLCGAGAVLLAVNAAVILRRWRHANDMTRVVAELLGAMGIPLRRQILIKASLSATAAVALLVDLMLTLLWSRDTNPNKNS